MVQDQLQGRQERRPEQERSGLFHIEEKYILCKGASREEEFRRILSQLEEELICIVEDHN